VKTVPLDRRNIIKLAGTVCGTMQGRNQAMKIIRKFKPDVVISTGSYVSVPVVLAGHSYGASVYLHEQNGFPGVSNRFLSRFATKVFLGFEAAREHFADQSKIIYSGNPVRSDFGGRSREEDRRALGIPENDFVIMVFGGSLGSETTNTVGEEIAREYAGKEGYTVIWGTGSMYYDEITERFARGGFSPDNVRISAFIKNMPEVLSAADITISRSGALSTAETTMEGRAAIFIPSPNVTADHQYYNAKAVADAGGAFIVREDENTVRDVMRIIRSLDSDRDQIKQMEAASRSVAPVDAADIICDTIMETYRK
jgi:UDP-N-acetylglucosamine--N-acetylmuramyl-(pentapeptide) pyrophosphoryl-undecaprenol N-acetylglucosamine transferase